MSGTCDEKSSKEKKPNVWDEWDDWDSTQFDEIAAEIIKKQRIEKVYLPCVYFTNRKSHD